MADRGRRDPLQQSDQHNQRGIDLADRGWLDEAIREFEKAIALDPLSAHAHDNLASVLVQKGKLRDALRSYLRALELEPSSPTSHYNLASFLTSYARDMAIEEYKEAITGEPDFIDAHVNLGLALADGGDYDGAIAAYHEALRIDPNDAGAKHELGTVLIDAGRHPEAIAFLRDVTKAEPDNIDAWIDLATCYTRRGFLGEAEKAIGQALNLDKADVMANYTRAVLSMATSDHGAAIHALRIAFDTAALALPASHTVPLSRLQMLAAEDRAFDALREHDDFIALLRPLPTQAN
jgi:tetratricopeptide (TPR) repeat protein